MHELPTTGANRSTMKLVNQIARYLQGFSQRRGCRPPRVSLNSRQWTALQLQAEAHGMRLEECSIGGVLLVNIAKT